MYKLEVNECNQYYQYKLLKQQKKVSSLKKRKMNYACVDMLENKKKVLLLSDGISGQQLLQS
jgi:hypothetical protein